MRSIKISKTILLFITLIGCYPVSHVVVGDRQPPLEYNDVKVYIDYPKNYNKIAIIEASSDISFKDFSIELTHQQKTNKTLERLKEEAASLGANGIVIQNISTNIKQHLSFNNSDKGQVNASSFHEKQKALSAIAIFVN